MTLIAKSIKRKFIIQKSVWIYMLIITIISIVPVNNAKFPLNDNYVLEVRLDYLAHFIIFIPLMYLIRLSSEVNFKKDFKQILLWVFAALLFSWVTEGIQFFIPYRAFNVNDLLANTIGVLLGSLTFILPYPTGCK